MNEESPQLIVTTEWSLARLLIIFILFLGIGAGVFATLTFRDVRSKAASQNPTPTPLVEVVLPSPNTNLSPPYLRLVVSKKNYGFNASVPVDVYLNTNGSKTVEADIALTFDTNLVDISKSEIVSTGVFKSLNVDEIQDGKVAFSLFVNPQIGHEPITLEKETKIATLSFKTKALTGKTQIKFEFNRNDTSKTALIPLTQTRPDKPQNLLTAVEGVDVEITQ